jgi:hypothetical protein
MGKQSGEQYGFEVLRGSGEVYAVRRGTDGVVTGVVGPLAWDDRNPRDLPWYDYDGVMGSMDVQWARELDADGRWVACRRS